MKENQHNIFKAYAMGNASRKIGTRPDIKTIKEGTPGFGRMLKPATDAMWDAWLIGLEQSGYKIHSRPEREKESMEPEI